MKKAWIIFRALIVALVAMLIATPVSLYIILSSGWAQNDIRKVAINELNALLGTDVNIGKVEIHPFNRLSIYDISAKDDYGRPALKIDEISVAFELFYLLRTGKLVIDFALIDSPDVTLYKKSDNSPLNIADIIAGLKSDNNSNPQSKYDLRANTVVIRKGVLHYDVLDAPTTDSIFNPRHIAIDNIFLNAYIPRISNDEYRVEIDRFGFREKNGFELEKLQAAAAITPHGSKLERLSLKFQNSELEFDPINLNNNHFSDFERVFKEDGINIGLQKGSTLYLPDFASFAPALAKLTDLLDIELSSKISANDAVVEKLNITGPEDNLNISLAATAHNLKNKTEADLKVERLDISMNAAALKNLASALSDKKLPDFITNQRPTDLFKASLSSEGRISSSRINARMAFAGNKISVNGSYDSRDSLKTTYFRTAGNIDLNNMASLMPANKTLSASTRFKANGRIAGRNSNVDLRLDSTKIDYNGHKYSGIELIAKADNSQVNANLSVNDPLLHATADCYAEISGKSKFVDTSIDLFEARLNELNLIGKYPGYNLSGHVKSTFVLTDINDIAGTLNISDIRFSDDDNSTPDLEIKELSLDAQPESESPGIKIESDIVSGYINGKYKVSSIYPILKEMVMTVFPAIDNNSSDSQQLAESDYEANNFTFNFKINECENLCKFFNAPVSVIYAIDVNGHFSGVNRSASFNIDAPYLLQGDKIIETTSVKSFIDAADDRATVFATTKMPTKKGPMVIVANLSGASDRIDNRIDWVIERKIPINGSFNFSTELMRNEEDNDFFTTVEFNPGTITFGEDVFDIRPSKVVFEKKRIEVNHFALTSKDKSISVNGIISDNNDDVAVVDINRIALLEIFETLEIDKALIGGTATGRFIARNLLTSEPDISCRKLHVDDISYNYCVLGNADIAAYWDNEKKSFNLDANITGEKGEKSHIYGDIFPAGEALDINFDVNHAPVGFMKPFMSAFASDLKGYASGRARLFGTFKYIDMEGDIFADDLKIKIDFTNTWYSATDSIKLRPGVIDIKNVTVRDINGHTALLNGFVRHKFFKEPSFDFKVTNAHDFLSYNVDANISPDWYGTVYGNGGATISGEPGIVNIGVKMSTAPKSTFTFVLSDRLDADEYSFITFKDSRAQAAKDSIMAADNTPAIVRHIRERLGNQEEDSPSAYNMDLQIDITPQARMILVMDPIGGDEIKATGAGNLRLTYESLNNDLKMYGTYTLDHGSYNFTLQDIIIKDFTIKEGSTIAFHGDPYSAQLDIQAIYSVNANLSDLDESFLLDKDLNRTNVPVHALLKVTGDMRQPDIDFDLEFPTLTQDTYRKVKSIVSTKEMMNRQIIYLLALNRFYTPDYMASTTKGNELFSVASSTISSQLSSMLGKLSDDWSIAPNLRSDRGDFSDVEVDVALSSRLLNNRLLFNGNFGYRDKTLNTNQFIGDFDIEYLLNPKGSWRLKAYNRYNDQNYYVRTAQTTQGVGIVFKKDFDNFFGFLRPKKKKNVKSQETDSIDNDREIVIPDSIAHPLNPLEY